MFHTQDHVFEAHDQVDRQESPPGVFSIYYVPWSRAVCKRFHDEMRPSHLVMKSLTHGSWSENIVNRKPPRSRWGGILSIKVVEYTRSSLESFKFWYDSRSVTGGREMNTARTPPSPALVLSGPTRELPCPIHIFVYWTMQIARVTHSGSSKAAEALYIAKWERLAISGPNPHTTSRYLAEEGPWYLLTPMIHIYIYIYIYIHTRIGPDNHV